MSSFIKGVSGLILCLLVIGMNLPYIKPIMPEVSETKKPKPMSVPKVSASIGSSAAGSNIPLPEPAMLYQYGGKDYHKDKESFNKHLTEVRNNAAQLNQWGYYNSERDEIYSRAKNITKHEGAHRTDDRELGSPSESPSFKEAVDKIPSLRNTFSSLHRQTPNEINFYSELYATLWEIADGDINRIPPPLQKFYMKEWLGK